mgnify:CR=1
METRQAKPTPADTGRVGVAQVVTQAGRADAPSLSTAEAVLCWRLLTPRRKQALLT